jgi:lipoate-protein ligase A
VEELTIRLLPFAVASGPENMAGDEVLLGSAVAGVASLRFYGWSEPTVSLGYFQPTALVRADNALSRLPLVRRPSGGETLVHDRELTYALALPAGPPWQPTGARSSAWLARMHTIIAAALQPLGVVTRMAGDEARSPGPEFLCFLHHTPGDLLIDSSKVVGSAQRRQRGALMQHGGILLARSAHTPSLPGIAELTEQSLDQVEVCDAIQRELTRQLRWNPISCAWTATELSRIDRLVDRKYALPAWNDKR